MLIFIPEFLTLNQLLGKFELKNSKLSLSSENFLTKFVEESGSYSDISFLNLQR